MPDSPPDFALMSHVKLRKRNSPSSLRFPRGAVDTMVVQWWERSLETSVIML